MKWERLKNNKCPKCNAPMERSLLIHHCSKCDFRIGHQKFDEVVNSLYKKKQYRDIDNQEALNNL